MALQWRKEHRVPDTMDPVEYCYEKGWTDGLPVIPPTPERVDAMLDGADRDPGQVLGEIPERCRVVTVGQVAVNAVMAGALPDYFPVILAAVEGMLTPEFGALGPTASTVGVGTLVMVHGPIARLLGVNFGTNLMGSGVRANATIGRAVQLVSRNLLGTVPGITEMATLGHPGKYSFCFAEDQETTEQAGWVPYHVEQGLHPSDSAVTVVGAHAPIQVNNRMSRTPEGVLDSIAPAIGRVGMHQYGHTHHLVILGPEHLNTLVQYGWSKREVREYLAARAVLSLETLKRCGALPGDVEPGDETTMLSAVREPDHIHIVVAGGKAGRYSAVCYLWARPVVHQPVCRRVLIKEPALPASRYGRTHGHGGRVTLLDPTNVPVRAHDSAGTVAPRPPDLTGKRLVVVDNGKAGAAQILDGLARRLTERYGVTVHVHRRSAPAKPLEPREVEALAGRADFAIAGVGD